ncbi:HNH endonuclease [Pseudomonas sp. CFBP 13602]|uniref:HNH endonuclease n=1 Tax=Pseudomonas sp. CFBP 13602 TaxID=2774039 RepID=UPI0017823535|nr:HNH endonuclease [Pseudomonas sp. CFBP 13602]MBD8825355.1 HNH endonuclease [Pseudomonas sp. CFBP 13602]
MKRSEFIAAMRRYRNGERPYKFFAPSWYFFGEDGFAYPLKYVYVMASGSAPLDVHTGAAKVAAERAGFEIFETNRAANTELAGMNFWWVNHKQTHRDEYAGGYIWSPKKKKNNVANEGYLNLTRVIAGDRIFSYAAGVIKAVGVATQSHVEAVIPPTHSDAADWEEAGWKVGVEWMSLETPIRPKDYLDWIVPLLPAKYSPIQKNGDGNQGCYLASISRELGSLLLELASQADSHSIQLVHEIDTEAEELLEEEILKNCDIPETERTQLIRSRVGQGIFRMRVALQEKKCRLTGVDNLAFLVASHIKPWRACNNDERLDGSNGLLLSPHVDKLFDRGWISFTDDGHILISDQARSVLDAWRLDHASSVGAFTAKQRSFLKFHREKIFEKGLQIV